MRFLRPRVPILSQKLSSLSSFLAEIGGRGDFGRGDAIIVWESTKRHRGHRRE